MKLFWFISLNKSYLTFVSLIRHLVLHLWEAVDLLNLARLSRFVEIVGNHFEVSCIIYLPYVYCVNQSFMNVEVLWSLCYGDICILQELQGFILCFEHLSLIHWTGISLTCFILFYIVVWDFWNECLAWNYYVSLIAIRFITSFNIDAVNRNFR